MMQGRQPRPVTRIQRALILQHEVHHGYRTDGCGAVERQLLAFVFYAGGGAVGEEFAGCGEVVFRGGEV